MVLYPKNQKPLSDELFENPTSEYRGTPFWEWNCQMTPEKITMIVDVLKEKGMGGGHKRSLLAGYQVCPEEGWLKSYQANPNEKDYGQNDGG